MNFGKQSNRRSTSSLTVPRAHTFVSVAQSVAFQCNFGFELFTTQITQVTPLCVVSVHVGFQIVPAAACVVTQAADIRLQTCTHGHKTYLSWTSMCIGHGSVSHFFNFIPRKKTTTYSLVKISHVLWRTRDHCRRKSGLQKKKHASLCQSPSPDFQISHL